MDFSDLARRFVLSDADNDRRDLAQEAAEKLTATPGQVSSWVQSISAYINTASVSDDGAYVDDDDETNLVARAKALDFLAATLEVLTSNPGFDVVLDHQVVKLLVGFFSVIFENDHKAGVLASARALTSLVPAKGFRAPQAVQVLRRATVGFGDDLQSIPQPTRIVLYRLIRLTVLPDASDPSRQIPPADVDPVLTGLLNLCRAERDPSALMVWFEIVGSCLARYRPAPEVTKKAFSVLSQYFPISVRDTQAPLGITPDDLKQALRRAFSSYHGMAEFVVPFLLGKLEQGEGIVLQVRADILRGLGACFAQFEDAAQSVVPFVDRTWSALRFEVRSGDQPDAVKLALEVIRGLTSRLQDAELSRFLAVVMMDCLEEMTSPNHVEAAGKLLATVMSSKPAAFSEAATKIIPALKTRIQSSVEGPQIRDLVAVLNSILQLRPVVVAGAVSDGQLGIAEDVLASLYHNTYGVLIESHLHDGAVQDDMMVVTKAVEGLALLIRQPDATAPGAAELRTLLLPDDVCADISHKLTKMYLEWWVDPRFGPVTEAVVLALSKISAVYPNSVCIFVSLGLPAHGELPRLDFLRSFVPALVFVAHNEVAVCGQQSGRFVFVVETLMATLETALDRKAAPGLWHQLALGILTSVLLFRKVSLANEDCVSLEYSEFERTVDREYPSMPRLDALDSSSPAASDIVAERPRGPYNDFVVLCYLVTKILYRRASAVSHHGQDPVGGTRILSADFQGTNAETIAAENSYLLALSRVAKVTVEEVGRRIEPSLQGRLSARAFDLFWGPEQTSGMRLPIGRITQLSLGVLQGAQVGCPDSLSASEHDDDRLLDLFRTGLLVASHSKDSPDCYLVRSVLANVANKTMVEENPQVRACIEAILADIVDGREAAPANDADNADNADPPDPPVSPVSPVSPDTPMSAGRLTPLQNDKLVVFENVLAVVGAIARRLRTSRLDRIFESLVRAPLHPELGHHLARRMGLVLAPSLDEESVWVKTRPTWKQRLYYSLVRPLVDAAMPKAGDAPTTPHLAARRVAAVAAARHVPLAAVGEDAARILRVAVCVARESPGGGGRDTGLALAVLRDVADGAPDTAQSLAGTLVAVVAEVLSAAPTTAPTTETTTAPAGLSRAAYGTRELALDLLAVVARLEGAVVAAEATPLLRLMRESVGWETRALRQKARAAQAAWSKAAEGM